MHNYHSSYKTFPFGWTISLPAFPDITGANASVWGIAILPYLEQGALYDQYDSDLPPFLPLPGNPNPGVIQTVLEGYLCPSTPGAGQDRMVTVNYSEFFPGLPPFTAAPMDYCPSEGVRGDYAHVYAGTGTHDGVLDITGVDPTATPPEFEQMKSKIRDILDGTSNTIMIGERSGGPTIYEAGGRMFAGIPGVVTAAELAAVNGGAWGDLLNGNMWLKGALYDGTMNPAFPDGGGGPCAINCTNRRDEGFFAFHPGGCHFLLADGSTKFVNEAVDQFAFASMISESGGEVFEMP
jgi:prepilin-type processing-associated H-X9-DG protein